MVADELGEAAQLCVFILGTRHLSLGVHVYTLALVYLGMCLGLGMPKVLVISLW